MKNDGSAAFPYFREIPEKKLDEVMTVFHPGMREGMLQSPPSKG